MTAETTTAAGVAIVDAAALALALKTIKPAIAKVGGLPVLAHVHLQGSGERLTVEGTNLELGLTATLDALTDGPLDVCLPYGALVKLIDPERSGDVTITAEEPGKTAVSQGKRVARIETLAGADFPLLAAGPTDVDVLLTAAEWSRVRASVLPAAAQDDSRPVLAGVYVACEHDGTVTLAAADGFRLALYNAGPAGMSFRDGYILPARGLAAIPARVDGELLLRHDADRGYADFRVTTRAASLPVHAVLRIIDGYFPDVRHIIPRDTPHAFRVEVSAIREAKDLHPGNDTIRILSTAVMASVPGVGDVAWNGTTVAYEGDGTMAPGFAVAARYADWAADAAGDGTHVTFQASAPNSPLVAERAGLLCLVMPMALS